MDYKSFFKKIIHSHFFILCIAGLFFFLSSLILTFGIGDLFVSPDETANFFFSGQFMSEGVLSQFIPLNTVLDDSLFPRSAFSSEGLLLPISFHGLPVLYGLVGSLFGRGMLPFLTPLLAFLAVLAWYQLVCVVWNKRIALLASLFLFFHPAFWFYTARGMMHNVLFVCLLIFGVWFFVIKPFKKYPWLNSIFAGFCVGLSLFVRTIEAPWVIGAVILSLVVLRKHISLRSFFLFLFSFLFAVLPIGFFNHITYGNPMVFGYTAQYEQMPETSVIEVFSPVISVLEEEAPSSISFPFSFDTRTAFRHGRSYGLYLVWWMGAATMIGLGMIFFEWGKRVYLRLKERRDVACNVPTSVTKSQLLFVSLFFFIGVSLLFFYGSWTIYDNPDTTQITLANSYMRYWLPIFVMTTVFAAMAIDGLAQPFASSWLRKTFFTIVFFLFFTLSISLTFFHAQDGLWIMREKLVFSQDIRADVLSRTEPESVIIVDRADKLFFSHRLIRYPLRDETTYDLMPHITSYVPLYYYGISLPQGDIDYLNAKKLRERGLQIKWIATYGEESLYQIYGLF